MQMTYRALFSAIALWLLWLSVANAAPKRSFTFDPATLTRVEYEPRYCKHTDAHTVHCSEASMTFGNAFVLDKTLKDMVTAVHSAPEPVVTPALLQSGRVVYTFDAAKCKPLPKDKAGRYVCRDVWWRD
jgi:hypothetical protein